MVRAADFAAAAVSRPVKVVWNRFGISQTHSSVQTVNYSGYCCVQFLRLDGVHSKDQIIGSWCFWLGRTKQDGHTDRVN